MTSIETYHYKRIVWRHDNPLIAIYLTQVDVCNRTCSIQWALLSRKWESIVIFAAQRRALYVDELQETRQD